jgi:hypothetical protein
VELCASYSIPSIRVHTSGVASYHHCAKTSSSSSFDDDHLRETNKRILKALIEAGVTAVTVNISECSSKKYGGRVMIQPESTPEVSSKQAYNQALAFAIASIQLGLPTEITVCQTSDDEVERTAFEKTIRGVEGFSDILTIRWRPFIR